MEQIDINRLTEIKSLYTRPGMVKIYVARHVITGNIYCVKQITTESIYDANEKYNEIFMMASLHHENIISIRSCFIGGQTNVDSISIIMDYYSEGDLETLILKHKQEKIPFSEETILIYLNQLLDALSYMQSKNIAHRDLKPHNIFLDGQGTILKIGDLGSSKTISSLVKKVSDQSHTIIGTPLYLSPAIREGFLRTLSGQECRVPHDVFKSDVYSLGLILLYMASLNNPANLTDMNNLQAKLNTRMEEISSKYPTLKIFLEKMLQANEENRYDFIQLKELFTNFMNQPKYHCGKCNLRFDQNQLKDVSSSKLCETCYNQFMEVPAYCSLCQQTKRVRDFFILNNEYFCKSCLMNVNTYNEGLVCLNCNKFLFADLGCSCLEDRCYICKSAKHAGACSFVLRSSEVDNLYPYFQCSKCNNYISSRSSSNTFFTCPQDGSDFCIVCFKPSSENHHRCFALLEHGHLF